MCLIRTDMPFGNVTDCKNEMLFEQLYRLQKRNPHNFERSYARKDLAVFL